MIGQLHVALGYLSLGLALVVAVDAALGAWRAQLRSAMSERLDAVFLIATGVAAAGGLGIFVGGGRPAEGLHFVYAVLAFGAIPVAMSFTRGRPARQAAGARLIGALVAVILIWRLFQTG